VLVAFSALAVPAHAEDADEDGIGISVPVVGPTAQPVRVVPAASSGGRSAPAATNAVATDTAAPVPASDDMLIAGGLYVSDIQGGSRPTVNPFEGVADAWVTLRNLSNETIDVTAEFSLATFAGSRIDGAEVVASALKPGETRVVGAAMTGTGQWPFVVARVDVIPPDTIAGQQTAPVSRAAIVYVLPWLGLIGLVLIALALVLLRVTAGTVRGLADPVIA
jgi:hypothetical protein